MFLEIATTIGALTGAFLAIYLPTRGIAMLFGVLVLTPIWLGPQILGKMADGGVRPRHRLQLRSLKRNPHNDRLGSRTRRERRQIDRPTSSACGCAGCTSPAASSARCGPDRLGQDWYEYQKGVHPRARHRRPEARDAARIRLAAGGRTGRTRRASCSSRARSSAIGCTSCTQTEVLSTACPSFERSSLHLAAVLQRRPPRAADAGRQPAGRQHGPRHGRRADPGGRASCDIWNVLGDDPWARFSPRRRLPHGRDHQAAPRPPEPRLLYRRRAMGDALRAADAVSLVDPARRIPIGLERVHDGIVHERPGLLHDGRRQGRHRRPDTLERRSRSWT